MENNGKVLGVDFTPFNNSIGCFTHIPGLLYYGDLQITDHYYIKYPRVWDQKHGEYTNIGEHRIFVVGEVKEGDYLTTSIVRGAAMKTDNKDIAFAVVTRGREPELGIGFDVVGGCYARFL